MDQLGLEPYAYFELNLKDMEQRETIDPYRILIQAMRERFALSNAERQAVLLNENHPQVPLVPFQLPGVVLQWVILRVTYGEDYDIYLAFQRESIYFYGFRVNQEWYEYKLDGATGYLPQSTSLGMEPNYLCLSRRADYALEFLNVHFNLYSLIHAVRQLKINPNVPISTEAMARSAIQTIIMFPEAIRFKPIFDGLVDAMTFYYDFHLSLHQRNMLNLWDVFSKEMRVNSLNENHLLAQEVRSGTGLTNIRETREAVLIYKPITMAVSKRNAYSGCHLAMILNVTFSRPVVGYGYVRVDDLLGRAYVMQVEGGDLSPSTIVPRVSHTICATGCFSVGVCFGNAEFNLIDDSIVWDPFYPRNVFDGVCDLLHLSFANHQFNASVHGIMLSNGHQATVTVSATKRWLQDFQVRGTIDAEVEIYECMHDIWLSL